MQDVRGNDSTQLNEYSKNIASVLFDRSGFQNAIRKKPVLL